MASDQHGDGVTHDAKPGWEPRGLRCRCGAEAADWTHSPAQQRAIKRLYADADGRLPACPACDDRNYSIDTHRHISRSIRDIDGEGDRDAVLPLKERRLRAIRDAAADGGERR